MQFKHFAEFTKLEYAITFGAALLYMMHRQRDACGLITFDDSMRQFIPAKSSYAHLRHIFSQLEAVQKGIDASKKRKTASSQVLHEIAERLHRRSLVIVITDLFENVQQQDALLSSLKHFKHKNHEVILFHVLEKRSERELDFPDQRFVFEDLETGTQLDLIPAQIKEDYKKKISEYSETFKRVCRENRIDYVEIDTESDIELGLLSFLNKRRSML
jgi:uncharacterized protein (DUF58 family)